MANRYLFLVPHVVRMHTVDHRDPSRVYYQCHPSLPSASREKLAPPRRLGEMRNRALFMISTQSTLMVRLDGGWRLVRRDNASIRILYLKRPWHGHAMHEAHDVGGFPGQLKSIRSKHRRNSEASRCLGNSVHKMYDLLPSWSTDDFISFPSLPPASKSESCLNTKLSPFDQRAKMHFIWLVPRNPQQHRLCERL